MTNQTETDRSLVSQMSSGDEGALISLYHRYGERILNYLDGMLEDPQLAEEVLQDVMYAVWRSASTFRGDCKVRTWLYTIARNHAINAQRRRKLPVVPFDDAFAISFSEDFRQIERKQALNNAFDALPFTQRELLELKFYHGLTLREIASILCVSLGTVHNKLNAAKQQLRQSLLTEGIDHA